MLPACQFRAEMMLATAGRSLVHNHTNEPVYNEKKCLAPGRIHEGRLQHVIRYPHGNGLPGDSDHAFTVHPWRINRQLITVSNTCSTIPWLMRILVFNHERGNFLKRILLQQLPGSNAVRHSNSHTCTSAASPVASPVTSACMAMLGLSLYWAVLAMSRATSFPLGLILHQSGDLSILPFSKILEPTY